MSFKTAVIRLFASDPSVSLSDRDYKYLIRKRDGTYWGAGGWVTKKKRAKKIAGAERAWNYAVKHLSDYIEEIDVVIP